jgi:hypothetical protein
MSTQRFRVAAASAVLAAGLAGCASIAADPFGGRYRSVSGADHDQIVVAPASAGRWTLALERVGFAPTPHPDGVLVEAPAAQMTQWFEPELLSGGAVRCLATAAGEAKAPVLCATQPGVSFRMREPMRVLSSRPIVNTGWLLLAPVGGGVDVTELIKG